VALLPYTNQEAMTESGVFDRTKFRMLCKPNLTLPQQFRIKVVTSATYPAGMVARSEGEAQKYPKPFTPSACHHIEVSMIKEQH